MDEKRRAMESEIQVWWYGSLLDKLTDTPGPPVRLNLPEPAPLGEILERLQIPPDWVQLVMVNHRAVPPDTLICPNDRVSLFPREYPVFADWRNFRLAGAE